MSKILFSLVLIFGALTNSNAQVRMGASSGAGSSGNRLTPTGVLLSTNPTLTFTSNSVAITGDNIASDGEAGSQAISDIDIQIYNISDASGTFLNSLSWQDADWLACNDVNFSGLAHPQNENQKGMVIKSANGSEFSFKQFKYYNWGETQSLTNTVKGYRNGTEVTSTTFEGYVSTFIPFLVTFGSDFNNVDEVRFYISAGGFQGSQLFTNHSINNIQVGPPAVSNIAPTFSNATTSLSVCQSAAATSINSLLQITDTDASQIETFSVISNPSHGSITTGTTVGSGTNVSPTGWIYTPTNGYSGNDTFTIQVSDGTATASKTITVTVSLTLAPSASAQSFCTGATVANLVASPGVAARLAPPASYKWYTASTGGSPLSTSTALVTGTYYVSYTQFTCESSRTSVAVTINTTPAPSASAQTFCSGATVADLAATGTSLKWYSANSGGSALATSTALSSGTYYVSQTLNSCEGTRTSVVVTVNTTPLAPTASEQTFCAGATVANLVASPGVARLAPPASYKWYTASTGGSPLSTSTALVTGTYYVSYTQLTCESSRTSVAVTINTTPAPSASAQTFCSGATVADLAATGTSLKWYSANSGGSALATSTALSSGTYYVSQTLNSCESTRTSVSVTVNTTPPAPSASAQTFCAGATVSELVASPGSVGRYAPVAAYRWYTSSIGGTALATSTTLVSGTYYVSQFVNSCEGERTSVSVTVNTTQVPTASAQTFCSGATVTDLVASSGVARLVPPTSYKWYTTSTGGSALATSTALSSGTYYVSQTLNDCESDRTSVVVTIDAPTVAGTISGATTLSSITNSTTLNLSGYTGTIQWQSSNALAGTYTDIGGATLATYTATNLTTTTYYRAVVSNGVCSPEISSPATMTVSLINSNLSKVIVSQCGATLSAINTLIRANAITGASHYKFKVVNGTTTEIIEPASGRWFRLTSLPGGTFYNTAYTISVAVKRNNVWGDYGDECVVTTPAFPATEIQNAQCGSTLSALNSLISANAVTNISGYRFKVVNGASTEIIESSYRRWFRLTSLPGGALYNTTYTISVATKYNGVWSEYGTECAVTTPAFPLTKVQDSQCGATLASITTFISADGVNGASGYRFKVVNQTTEETIEAASGSRWFRLTSLTGGALYNTTYTISVASKYNGVWSDYGNECAVTTPAATLTELAGRQCGMTLALDNATLLYATAVSVAQKYRFEVSLGSDVYTYDTATSSERSFRMTNVPGLTLISGTTYAVRVAIMVNGVWQPYGVACTITTYSIPTSVVRTMNQQKSDFNVITYPNPFTENFNLNLTSLSEEKVTVMVYDMTGKLLERKEVLPSDLPELQLGNNFATGVYNVIVSQGKNSKSLRVIKK